MIIEVPLDPKIDQCGKCSSNAMLEEYMGNSVWIACIFHAIFS